MHLHKHILLYIYSLIYMGTTLAEADQNWKLQAVLLIRYLVVSYMAFSYFPCPSWIWKASFPSEGLSLQIFIPFHEFNCHPFSYSWCSNQNLSTFGNTWTTWRAYSLPPHLGLFISNDLLPLPNLVLGFTLLQSGKWSSAVLVPQNHHRFFTHLQYCFYLLRQSKPKQ